MGALAKVIGSTVLLVEEDGDTGNVQSYSLQREMEIEGTTNTVMQIRLDLDDYTPDGDEPIVDITLGFTAGTFTADAGTDVITTAADHLREVNDEIVFSTTGGLPAPLTAGVTYYVLTTPASNTMTVSEEPGGATVDITTTGTGTHSFEAFGTDGGVQLTSGGYLGGGAPTEFPDITIKDQRSGVRDDFRRIKTFQLVLIPTNPTLAATAQVWITGGVNTDRMSHFLIPLELDADANSGDCAFVTAALPAGWNYSDTNPMSLTIEESTNATVLINLLGQ